MIQFKISKLFAIKISHPLILMAILLLNFSCKKTVTGNREDSSYMQVFSEQKNQGIHFIKRLADGNMALYYFIRNDSLPSLNIMKVNQEGLVLDKKEILKYNNSNSFYHLPDGSTLWTGDGPLIKTDPNGNIVFTTHYSSYNITNPAVVSGDGKILVCSTIGNNTGIDYAQVDEFGSDGSYIRKFNIQNSSFAPKFKVIALAILKSEESGSYIFTGFCYPNWNGSLRNNKYKYFVAKQKYSGSILISNKLLVIDTVSNDYDYNFLNLPLITSDKKMVFLNSRIDYNGVPRPIITKTDEDLNIIYQKEALFGSKGNSYLGLSENKDGSLIASGWLGNTMGWSGQALATKFDINGNMAWSKIYSSQVLSGLVSNVQLEDESLLFAGYTSSFGKGKNYDDMFLLKTDKEGNLK